MGFTTHIPTLSTFDMLPFFTLPQTSTVVASDSSSIMQAVAVCGITWLLWKFFRGWVVVSSMDNLPGPPSDSWLFGNLRQLLALDSMPFQDHLVDKYPGIALLRGGLGSKILYVFDPDALHHVLVKDQQTYEEGRFFTRTNALLFGQSLLATLGDHHRKQRKMLNPVFSPKHMRYMLPIFYDVGHLLAQAIDKRVSSQPTELDIATWMGRAALEFMGQAGLGYSLDPLIQDKPDEYAVALKSFSYANARSGLPRRLLPYFPTIRFAGIGHWILSHFPHYGVRTLVNVSDVLWKRSCEIYADKKAAIEGGGTLGQQVGDGKDIMSILMAANMEASGEDKLDEQELIAQMSTLILAGMDTTSNALCLILTHLAEHPDIQQELREEILNSGADKGLEFDTLMNLPLLEAVCRETLRLDAPLAQVFRETRKDIILPLDHPIRGRDGSLIHEILVPKDTVVVAGLMNCNRYQALWGEDAKEWKPKRWLAPLPESLTEAKIPGVYSNLMTFLGGGRSCIGFKFSQMEMKVVLSLLLSKFTFEKSPQRVFWNLGAVRYPSVAGYGAKACLPMKIGLYKGDGN
ncbi:cytochrome P450 [Trametes gibbosa]|nr:cytochrome P450 [Trametes gibbosa]